MICKYNAFTQAPDTKINLNKQNYAREVLFFAGPSGSTIRNENIANDEYAIQQWCLSPEFGVSYMAPAGEHVVYCAGLEFNQFKSQVLYRGYFRSETEKKDRRAGLYIPLVDANYTQRLNLTTLDIPVSFRARLRVAKGLQAFVESGVRLSALLSSSQTLDGYLSRKGLYYASPYASSLYLLVEDTLLGFGTIKYDNKRVNYLASKGSVSGLFSAGMQASFSDRYFMTWQATALFGLTDLASAENGDYQNIFEDKTPYRKSTATKFSLRIGIGIRLE